MTVLNKTMKAAAVAVALGATVLPAAPALAQSGSFSFQFGTPGFGFSINDGRHHNGRWHNRPDRMCMSDREVRRDLRRDGYDEIRFFDRRGRIVQVTAELGRRDYRIAYDTCRGRIVDRDRIRS